MSERDLTVNELVKKVDNGEIQLPEMQRQFVWKKTQVRDLFDSLYKGYPTGNILTWHTQHIETARPIVDDQDLKEPDKVELLLDGQQRLTSLHSIMYGKTVNVRGIKKTIDILFNLNHPPISLEIAKNIDPLIRELSSKPILDESTFISVASSLKEILKDDLSEATKDDFLNKLNELAFIVASKKLANLPNWVSVTELFQSTKKDVEIYRDLGVNDFDDPKYNLYNDRLHRVRGIRDVRFHVYTIESFYTYEEATEIFVRVNTLGAKLRGTDLALAQITSKWDGSFELIQKQKKDFASKGFDLDLGFYVRNLVASATDQSRFKSIGTIKREILQKSLPLSRTSLEYAINFLRSNIKIDNPFFLSSPFILITLANYFRHNMRKNLSPSDIRLLRFWVLTTSIKARYSKGSAESYLDQDLAILKEPNCIEKLVSNLESQVIRFDIESSELLNRNSRSPYFKTMYLSFKESGAEDWKEPFSISRNLIGPQFKLEFHHIFPQKLLKSKGYSSQKINDICNLAFITGKSNRWIGAREPIEYLSEVCDKGKKIQLSFQCVPTNDQNLWKLENYEDFLEQRRSLVVKRLNEYIGT